MCKAVVDIENQIIAVDAELHADQESQLLEDGSLQQNLWGINLHPGKADDNFIEYTSLINIRPHDNNCSMEIESSETREKIRQIVETLIRHET
jgi:hypothetical protein